MTAVVAFQLLQSTADKWAATYLDRSVLLNKIFLTLNTGLLFPALNCSRRGVDYTASRIWKRIRMRPVRLKTGTLKQMQYVISQRCICGCSNTGVL